MTESSAAEIQDASAVAPQMPPAPNSRPGLAFEAKIAFSAIALFALTAMIWPHTEDRSAPGGELQDARGRLIALESMMAPVTLVHFWSTWCPPCITETPSIQRLAADFADQRDFNLVMIAVADDVQKAESFLGANAGLYDPDWKIAKRYRTDKLPETHLVVRGELVESFIGMTDWDSAEVRTRIEQALETARNPPAEDA